MVQVQRNRGVQPPDNHLFASPRKSGRVQADVQAGQKSHVVRFSGNGAHAAVGNAWQGFVRHSVPTFQNITEVFIWGFLAQDVIAMWLPRIYALLTEGRKKYDPQSDPAVKTQPFGTQFKKWVAGNYKGLNWDNFCEGTKREFATGPGLLMVPAAVFLAVSRIANSAVKMPFASVEGLGKGLAEHFEAAHLNNKTLDDKTYQKAVQNYISELFQDSKLKETLKDEKGGKFLDGWSKAWVQNFDQADANEKAKTTQKLSQQLQDTVRKFNREHRSLKYAENSLIKDDYPLLRSESTWVSYRPTKQGDKAAKHLKQMPMTELLHDLEKMEGLVKAAKDKAVSAGSVSEAMQQTMARMVKVKFGLSVGATLVTSAYLIKLAFWAQNHDSYQATRLLNEKASEKKGSHRSAPMAESNCSATPQSLPTTAGSTFGLQPAFSNSISGNRWPFTRPFHTLAGGPIPFNQSGSVAPQGADLWFNGANGRNA